jgi:hypothetical protein
VLGAGRVLGCRRPARRGPGRLGTNDLVDGNPLLIRCGDLLGVGPLRVDVALLHAPLGDADGSSRR